MAIYIFRNPNTGDTKEVWQDMGSKHEYSEEGVKFERVFTSPNASFDTQLNPDSQQQFLERTGKMKGTIGDMWDYSKELSEKRAQKTGVDPLREKAEKNYSKKRKGAKIKDHNTTAPIEVSFE